MFWFIVIKVSLSIQMKIRDSEVSEPIDTLLYIW